MDGKLLSKLTKREILSLPGFNNKKATLAELRNQLKNRLIPMNINKRGVRVNDYIKSFKKDDNELFNKIKNDKINRHQNKLKDKHYKQSIKDIALEERSLFNLPVDYYTTTRTESRQLYEKRIKEVNNI